MNKRIVLVILAIISLIGITGFSNMGQKGQNANIQQVESLKSASPKTDKPVLLCDGKNVKTDCSIDGVVYKTYIYHPAIAAVSHTETQTVYEKRQTGYCTLCDDGTYSPTCATGRGACSYHGGVAVWNAAVYENVPVQKTNTIIDKPAQDAYFEKIAIQQ